MADSYKIETLVNTDIDAAETVSWEINCLLHPTIQGSALPSEILLAGKVVSATDHREIKIEAYESLDGETYNKIATEESADWSSAQGDTDDLYIIPLTCEMTPFLKIIFTGLTDCAATLTDMKALMK